MTKAEHAHLVQQEFQLVILRWFLTFAESEYYAPPFLIPLRNQNQDVSKCQPGLFRPVLKPTYDDDECLRRRRVVEMFFRLGRCVFSGVLITQIRCSLSTYCDWKLDDRKRTQAIKLVFERSKSDLLCRILAREIQIDKVRKSYRREIVG